MTSATDAIGQQPAVAASGGRVAALTGVRAVAALLVVGTHAAYTTGKYAQGYVGLLYSRMEIGVPIFFALSGFLLFRPWVAAVSTGAPDPSVRRYAWHRVRRIMPAYVVTVLAAYLLYHFHEAGPNPGHTWNGLFRNLTLTQLYTDNYLFSWLHQGLTQMWSLAVEVAFYVALPVLAYLLMVVLCRRQWRPGLLLGVVTADCAPVLLADRAAGVIGAAHAGWKGALAGVTDATIAAMVALGARREAIAAAIGPCIAQASYEVDAGFEARFLAADAANARFFAPARPGHARFDLEGYVAHRLTLAGVDRVERLGQDTYAEDARFFSFRRSTHRGEPAYGRQISAIALP